MPDQKIFHYLSCPFCGKTVETSHIEASTLENFDISWEVLQAREQFAGPGRRHKKVEGVSYGFKLIPKQCLTIQEMLADPQWSEIAKGVVNRIVTIYGAYLEAGLIKRKKPKRKAKE